MAEECWVRLWSGKAASLMHYQGEKAVVYVAGEEMVLSREFWASLPPYRAH
jgi:hypothetical protein